MPVGSEDGTPRRPLPTTLFATELSARIVSALVLAGVALLAAYEGGWLFAAFWVLAAVIVAAEWIGVTRASPRGTLLGVFGVGVAITCVLALLDRPGWALSLGLVIIALALRLAQREDRPWIWACLPVAAVIGIVPPLVREHPAFGLVGLLWMFAVVWTTDIAAFFTGRALGGPKLWPRVSPKKTWSGFLGGLVAGTGAGVLVASTGAALGWAPVASLSLVALVSAVGSVVSQGGDLAESAMKRRFDVKDSGHLIPGHGGVMDRLDGFWSVAVLAGLIMLAREAGLR